MGARWRPPRQCPHCFCRHLPRTTVSHDVYARGRLVRFPRVPAALCVQCGTRWFDPKTTRALARAVARGGAPRGTQVLFPGRRS